MREAHVHHPPVRLYRELERRPIRHQLEQRFLRPVVVLKWRIDETPFMIGVWTKAFWLRRNLDAGVHHGKNVVMAFANEFWDDRNCRRLTYAVVAIVILSYVTQYFWPTPSTTFTNVLNHPTPLE